MIGIEKSYNIMNYRGKFFDISIPLSLEQWRTASRYRISLLGNSYGIPAGDTSYIQEKCLDSTMSSFRSFYVSRSGDTMEYHLFHDIIFMKEEGILHRVDQAASLYENFNQQNSNSLEDALYLTSL